MRPDLAVEEAPDLRPLGLALAFLPLPVSAGLAAEGQPPGDPLPDGAVLRLGTTRLRPGGSVGHLAFSPDGTKLATGGGNSHNGSAKLWDVSPWQQRLLLDSDGRPEGMRANFVATSSETSGHHEAGRVQWFRIGGS